MSFKTPVKIGSAPFCFLDVLKRATSFHVASVFSSPSPIKITNYIFKLNSNVTMAILSISIFFIGIEQYFGDPIICSNAGSPTLTRAEVDYFCWLDGVFTIVNNYSGNPEPLAEVTGLDNAYPGVKRYDPHKGDLKMPHKYYQWVYYILCIQVILFYTPMYIWNFSEGGRLQDVIDKIKDRHILQYEGLDRFQVVQDTLDVMMLGDELYSWFFFSELLYLLHLVMEIFFLNAFLGGKFFMLGFQWLHYTLNSDNIAFDPLIKMFPRLTKCSFPKYGTSGTLETYETLCLMPLNMINEKVFVILWFWFLALLLATIYHIFIYRGFKTSDADLRFKMLVAIAPTADERFLTEISKFPGRWFVMNTIATNLKPYFFRDLLDILQEDHFTEKLCLKTKVFMKDFIVDGKVPFGNTSTVAVEKKKEKDKDSSKKKKKDKDGEKDKDKDKSPFSDSGSKENADQSGEENTNSED